MLRLNKQLALAAAAMSLASHAHAAAITKAEEKDLTVIAIAGDMALGDDRKFIDLAIGARQAIVILDSPGGNLSAGLEIGRAIHLKGFTTAVGKGDTCASACALAWLGGRRRLLFPGARIGFHAAYYKDGSGNLVPASSGNALVGAYLNQIGMSPDAVVFVTSQPPTGIAWLTQGDALRNGIDMKQIEEGNPEANIRQNPSPPQSPQTVTEVVPSSATVKASPPKKSPDYVSLTASLVIEYWSTWSSANDQAMSFLDRSYGDNINFFGKVLPKYDVLSQKRAFTQRWQSRTYTPATTPTVNCYPMKLECQATGSIDWDVRNDLKRTRSRGLASYEFTISFASDSPKITSERTELMSRVKSSY